MRNVFWCIIIEKAFYKGAGMDIYIRVIIILGAGLLVANIIRYGTFMRSSRDVLSSGKKKDRNFQIFAYVLLIFFLLGYLFIGIFSDPDLMMSQILFFGSVFVFIVETLMFRLVDTAKTRSIDIAEILVGVIDTRDPNLNGHSRHVQMLTMLFYKHLPKHLKKDINPVSLEYASLMHDVGKLGVPEAILNKPDKLTDEEWVIMKKHPEMGLKILDPLKSFDDVSSWILYHHERVDGKGYHGLRDDEIPLPARLIAIADTYSAITMRRSYKEPKSHEEAVKIISEVAGTQLDRYLVTIFLTIPKEEIVACIPEDMTSVMGTSGL